MAVPRLQMIDIAKRFGATVALDGVSLSVGTGEVLGLVGENGAGKSTLMKVLAGAHQPDSGRMLLNGEPFNPTNPLMARRRGVAMIYQELTIAPHLSVAENIVLGSEPRHGLILDRAAVRRTAVDALRQLGRPDLPIDRQAGLLSIADQQLIEIARALAVGSKVLVLDEPTSSLTQRDTALLFDLIRRLKATGLSIIYISHFLEEVRAVCDTFTVLRDGRTVGSGRVADTPIDAIIRMMVGRDVSDLYPRSVRETGEPLLEVHRLAGIEKPLDSSLTVHRGEVVGIAGLIGAGRTEFLRAIFGLDAVRTGTVRVGSLSADSRKAATPDTRWRQGCGLVSEDRKTEGLALSLSIADNLTLSRLPSDRFGWTLWPARQRRSASDWVRRLGVRCRSVSQPIGDLSGGNQQKVAFARLLYHDVDLLLLDEPTRGIDVGSKAQIYQLIDDLARGDPVNGRRPKAVLIVSSYLPELLGVCDRIAVMCRGRLGQAKPVQAWTEHDIMLEATGTI